MTDDEGASRDDLAYLRSDDAAYVVGVTAKEPTVREVTAMARAGCSNAVMARLSGGSVLKGDVSAMARAAGIQAAKETPVLPPLAHVVGLHGYEADVEPADDGMVIRATAWTADRTGVEVETLITATVAALVVVDTVKGVGCSVVTTEAKIVARSDGRSGSWVWPEG